jgi:hypothetical protein
MYNFISLISAEMIGIFFLIKSVLYCELERGIMFVETRERERERERERA